VGNNMKKILLFLSAITCILFGLCSQTYAFSRGIYLTQSTEQNTAKLTDLIQKAKQYNIDTFVIDVNVPSKIYAKNISKIVASGIHYVARIVIFPHGGTHAQITNKEIWAKRLKLAKYAVGLGASAIQLDYIRYRAEYPPNTAKAKRILTVVQYFKNELRSDNVSLQMDIYGIASIKPAHTIGQDPQELAGVVNAFCPMVYPSHFEPFREHAVRPYEIIAKSVKGLRNQLVNHPNVSIFAYIELFNYRYKLSHEGRLNYIRAQMKAAHDGGANGWYVWSATNHYKPLFQVLAQHAESKK
jgi:hypothetical protein